VKTAAQLESARLFDRADPHRLSNGDALAHFATFRPARE
jgi:hypothetical protein